MSKRARKKRQNLTPEEIERQKAEQLPDREVMSLISPPTIAPEPDVPIDPVPDKAV
jgi:hypothetical protein